jgi:hypothetical protein
MRVVGLDIRRVFAEAKSAEPERPSDPRDD